MQSLSLRLGFLLLVHKNDVDSSQGALSNVVSLGLMVEGALFFSCFIFNFFFIRGEGGTGVIRTIANFVNVSENMEKPASEVATNSDFLSEVHMTVMLNYSMH